MLQHKLELVSSTSDGLMVLCWKQNKWLGVNKLRYEIRMRDVELLFNIYMDGMLREVRKKCGRRDMKLFMNSKEWNLPMLMKARLTE